MVLLYVYVNITLYSRWDSSTVVYHFGETHV